MKPPCARCPRRSCTATWTAACAWPPSRSWPGATASSWAFPKQQLAERARVLTPLAGLEEVLARFQMLQKVLCGYEAIRRVAFENVEDAWRDGVRLAELRFSPPFIAAGKDLANDEIIEAVLDGVEEGAARYGLEVALIGILPRTASPQANQAATADLLRYARGSHRGAWRLLGFDLADSETARPPEEFLPLVERARAAGLGITIHSGENTSAAHVVRTLQVFGPSRIGHGIQAWGDPEALRMLVEGEGDPGGLPHLQLAHALGASPWKRTPCRSCAAPGCGSPSTPTTRS